MLAIATLDQPNLLILDEPTNHLDIDARNELLSALNDFEGAVILVSHDRRLLESTADQLWLVADGGVHQFDGDLDDYRRFLLSGENTPTRRSEPVAKANKEDVRRDAAEKRRRLKPLKDNVDAAEHEIAALNTEIAKYDRVLADPLLFSQDPMKAKNVAKKRADAVKRLADLEGRWLKMQEEYENAMAE
jgi:ATP-binding cassette subfamily F protein 3